MTQTATTPFTLPALPFQANALEPYISAATVSVHYDGHHRGYVEKLNQLAAGSVYADLPLEEVIHRAAGHPEDSAIFNNAAQVWNHNFYWNSLSPKGGGDIPKAMARQINESFGSHEHFIQEFAKAGMDQFGSGWAWLIRDGRSLKIIKTPNAENPLSQGRGVPLLTIDVWEHAYYLDYQNRRRDYLISVLDHLLNWEFAVHNFNS